jgi:3',5'-nucleoside bisphosphate phosphatase
MDATMKLSYENLILSPDAAIDLQLHTVCSDGTWTAEALLDHLIAAGFSLAAITDHDRTDTQVDLQKCAAEKEFPLLVAVEMSSLWKGQLTDFLCYGFDPGKSPLDALAQDTTCRQHDNTRQVFEHLRGEGYLFQDATLEEMMAKPAAQQLPALLALVTAHLINDQPVGKTLLDAGFAYMTQPPTAIVEAAHQSGGICMLAHPGRSDGFICYDRDLLEELRAEAAIDGIEAHYPLHTPEQTALYLDYAAQYDLLVSAGSDSHHPEKPPLKYSANLSRDFLERLGIRVL